MGWKDGAILNTGKTRANMPRQGKTPITNQNRLEQGWNKDQI